METLSFTLGMLTIIAIALVVVIVIGIVKVFKQQKEIKSIHEWIMSLDQDMVGRFKEVTQEISQRERNIYDCIEKAKEDFQTHIRIVSDEDRAYTDRRIDKIIEKQILKG